MTDALPIPRSSVVFCEVEDGAVLLHVEDEVYFSLTEVAVRIWRLLPPATSSFDELCRSLELTYPDIPSQLIRDDARDLLTELLASGLVIAQPG